MSTYNGACHCGHHAYTVSLEQDKANHTLCHCNACKVLSGSEYTLNTIVPADALKFTKGSQSDLGLYTYQGDSGKKVDCFYCPKCTAHIYHKPEVMGGNIVVRTALLNDGRKSFKPAAEVYGKDRAGWVPEVAKTFEMFPPS